MSWLDKTSEDSLLLKNQRKAFAEAGSLGR